MPIKAPVPAPAAPYVYQPYPRAVKSKLASNPDGTPRVVIVHSKEEEARHTGVAPEEVIIEAAPDPEPPAVYKPIPYPRYVDSRHKSGGDNKVIVKDHIEEEYHTGIPVNEDGTPIVAEPAPELVIAGQSAPAPEPPAPSVQPGQHEDADF